MDSIDTKLMKAKVLCDDKDFTLENNEYYKIYRFTTENISGYIDYFNLKDKSLLTVGSSFDQALNANYCGTNDITICDINPFTDLYGYLKIAALIELDYLQFQEFFFQEGIFNCFSNKNIFQKNIFNKISPLLKSLSYDSNLFWEEIFELYSPKRINEFLFQYDDSPAKKVFNLYLRNEESYNKMKKTIKNINFKFVNLDIFRDNIDDKFDNIFLSNVYIAAHSIDEFQSLLNRINEHNLNNDGTMLSAYIYSYDYDKDKIKNTSTIREISKGYITDEYEVDSEDNIRSFRKQRGKDLILTYKK